MKVADRIGVEVDCPFPMQTVAYSVRSDSTFSKDSTRILITTDGMLLALMGNDDFFGDVDVLILDEAHERNLPKMA